MIFLILEPAKFWNLQKEGQAMPLPFVGKKGKNNG